MKLKFSIVLLIVAFAATAQVKLGINAGATQSGLRGNDFVKKYTYRTDFLVGASIEVALDSSFALVGNVNYERKTTSNDIWLENIDFDPIAPITYSEVELRSRLHYLTETIMARYYFGKSKMLFANAGFFGAAYLGETYKVDGEKTDFNNEDYIKSFDFGLSAGFGAAFSLSPKNTLSIELRDNLGLANINNINGGEDIRTHNLNLIANWSFTL
ncbi:MAG: porin family protein [Flavobacterium sp.]